MNVPVAHRLKLIGKYAADLVQDGMLVGLGTGSTAAAMVDALGDRVQSGLNVTGVATSNATAEQATKLGIPLLSLEEIDRLDMCIDGADEIDPELNLVKGAGGALLIEKLVARRTDRYVIISADEKLVQNLGTRMPLPVEVVPTGWTHTAGIIADLGMTPILRMKDGDAFISDGGHYIVDCAWPEHGLEPARLGRDLKEITGVVDHGLFIGMADTIVTISADGEITRVDRAVLA